MTAFRSVAIESIRARYTDEDDYADWLPLRDALDIGAFGVNAWRADAGGQLIERHDEADEGHEELYVVIRGRARFEIAGETLDAPFGTALAIPPEAERYAEALEDGTLVLTVGARRGEAFSPSPWEERELKSS